jgi:hypothetical protein
MGAVGRPGPQGVTAPRPGIGFQSRLQAVRAPDFGDMLLTTLEESWHLRTY